MNSRRFIVLTLFLGGLLALQLPSQQQPAPGSLPVYTPDGSRITGPHIVVGAITVPPGGATVTLTGAAAFASRDTYRCFTSIQRGPVPGNPLRIDGTKFTLPAGTSAGGWTEDFLCIGK